MTSYHVIKYSIDGMLIDFGKTMPESNAMALDIQLTSAEQKKESRLPQDQ